MHATSSILLQLLNFRLYKACLHDENNVHWFELIVSTLNAYWADLKWKWIEPIHLWRWFECELQVEWISLHYNFISIHWHASPFSLACTIKNRQRAQQLLPTRESLPISWQVVGTYPQRKPAKALIAIWHQENVHSQLERVQRINSYHWLCLAQSNNDMPCLLWNS